MTGGAISLRRPPTGSAMRGLCVRVDGRREVVEWPQRDVHRHLGGPLTIVGAWPECGAVAVALRESAAAPNPAVPGARGDVWIGATDEAGEEADLDVAALEAALAG